MHQESEVLSFSLDVATGAEDDVQPLAHAEFAFVSIDPDLYEPALAGLEFFYPRLSEGGAIIMHDYGNAQFKGVRQAVKEYDQKLIAMGEKPLKLVPLGDLHGSCVIVK